MKYWELKIDILKYAYENGLMIHPARDLDTFCKKAVLDPVPCNYKDETSGTYKHLFVEREPIYLDELECLRAWYKKTEERRNR